MPRTKRTNVKAQDRELANLLLVCRTERDLTLNQIAPLLKLTPAAISKVERGLRGLSRTSRSRLIEFLRKNGYFPKVAA